MKIIFIFLSLLLFSNFLEAYSTKIVISTFNSSENANRLVKKLPKLLSKYDELDKLFKKDGVIVHMKEINSCSVVIAETFTNEAIAKRSLQILRQRFPFAYLHDASSKDSLSKKNTKIVPKEEKSLLKRAMNFVDFTFLFGFIFFMTLVYLFVASKEKFDDY